MRAPFLAAVLAATACQSGGSGSSLQELKTSVNAYHEAFRWKNYPLAAQYLPSAERTAFLATFEEEGDAVNVESVQVLKVDLESDEAATLTVRYRYMKLPSVTVERTIVTQKWHRVEGRWIMEHEDPPLVALEEDPTASAEDEEEAEGEEGETTVEVEGPWQR